MTLSIIAFYCDVEILDHTNSHRPAWNMWKRLKTNGKYYKKSQMSVDVQGVTGSSPVSSTR